MGSEVYEGREFDWFAVDGDGYVGHFATAGYGPVPTAVLDRFNELRELDGRVSGLPVVGAAVGHLPGRIDDWLAMAQRGLFSYDWQHWSGPYRRAATPSVPVRVTELPDELRALVRVVEWPGVRFAESQSIRPETLCHCG
jgi:hypothetical protein